MFDLAKRRKAVLALLAALLIAAGYHVFLPRLMKNALLKEMETFGFAPASVVLSEARGGHAIFSDIKLGRDGFSTIANIIVAGGLGGISAATVDNLILTGETDDWGMPSITGWQWPKSLAETYLQSLDINDAQFDLLTPEGAIRISSKGQMDRQPDGTQKISAIVQGKQKQLTLDTRWESAIRPEGKGWNASIDIRDARIDFSRFSASRISGWLNLDSSGGLNFPNTSGQIAAGSMRFGKNISFSGPTLTIDNKDGRQHIILQGDIQPWKDMRLTADIFNLPQAPSLQATIQTKFLPDLIAFVRDLQKDMEENGPDGGGFLTGLLITPGNLARVEKEVARARYDRLELAITGPLYDLTGKIIALREKDGAVQRHIISLDPGD